MRNNGVAKKYLTNPLFGFLSHIRYAALAYIYAPLTFVKGVLLCRDKNNYNRRLFLNRWAFLPEDLLEKIKGKKVIWIDALSGGEITQVVTFCKMLKKNLPGYAVILSSNNDYSIAFAKKNIKELDYIFDSPWDIGWVVRKALKSIMPELIIFIEGPYMPVLANEAKKMNIRTVLASAFMRPDWLLHDHYFYRRMFFLNPYKGIDYILAKSGLDFDCLAQRGISAEKMRVFGNLKFDTQFLEVSDSAIAGLKKELRIEDRDMVLVAGSLHSKEEKLVVGAYHDLRKNNVKAKLIIVPRYNHFIPDIISEISLYKYPYVLRSRLPQVGFDPESVIIIDTFGELMYLYALSSMIIVGGSFFKRNPCGFGQNIVEPLLHFKPIFFGPYMGQFREITGRLLSVWSGMEIHSAKELGDNIMFLLKEPILGSDVISNIHKIVAENNESISRHVDFIKNDMGLMHAV